MAFHALLPPQDYMYSWLSRCSTAGGLVVVVVVDDWKTDHRRWLKEVSSLVGTTLKKNVYSFIRRPLGSLNYLRVWHDNTGWENYASWFVTAIVVRDVQTDEKFEFIINNWLAVDKGDGEVKHPRLWHPRAQKAILWILVQKWCTNWKEIALCAGGASWKRLTLKGKKDSCT